MNWEQFDTHSVSEHSVYHPAFLKCGILLGIPIIFSFRAILLSDVLGAMLCAGSEIIV